MARPTVLDVFCGAGGLSVGFQDAGYNVLAGIDSSEPALQTFRNNITGASAIKADIRTLLTDEITERIGTEVHVLVGGPSCQGFSTSGGLARDDGRRLNDPRNHLFLHYLRMVQAMRPAWIVFENVPGLLLYHHGEVANTICKAFADLGYKVEPIILLAADYGVPQLRRRLIFVGNRTNSPIRFPMPTHGDSNLWQRFALPFTYLSRLGNKDSASRAAHVTLMQAISDLPILAEGQVLDHVKYRTSPSSDYQRNMRQRSRYVRQHIAFDLAEFDRLAANTLMPGQNWTNIPAAARPARFQKIRPYDATTLMRRLLPNKPSYTITTKFHEASTGAFIHPDQNRTLSIREAARLQSFPDRFIFTGTGKQIRDQIGNAVPPLFARAVAEAILPSVLNDVFGIQTSEIRETLCIEGSIVTDSVRLHKQRRYIKTYDESQESLQLA